METNSPLLTNISRESLQLPALAASTAQELPNYGNKDQCKGRRYFLVVQWKRNETLPTDSKQCRDTARKQQQSDCCVLPAGSKEAPRSLLLTFPWWDGELEKWQSSGFSFPFAHQVGQTPPHSCSLYPTGPQHSQPRTTHASRRLFLPQRLYLHSTSSLAWCWYFQKQSYLTWKADMKNLYYRHLCKHTCLVTTSKFTGAQFQQENGRKIPAPQGPCPGSGQLIPCSWLSPPWKPLWTGELIYHLSLQLELMQL